MLATLYTAQIVKAVAASNSRVLIQSSWSALQGDNIPDSIYQLGPAPHDWLLPRMAAVVHHG
jgi:sterol 3beta-glucosyltransferase